MALSVTDKVDLDVYYDADYFGVDGCYRATVSRELFKSTFSDCPSIGFECDGQPIGGMIFDGESAHLAVLPSHHGRWARLLKPMLAWLYRLKPEVLVGIEIENAKALAFADRCGWERMGVEDGRVTYKMSPRVASRAARIDAPEPFPMIQPRM